MPKIKLEKDYSIINSKISSFCKWSKFRTKRAEAIDDYIAVKKRQLCIIKIVGLAQAQRILLIMGREYRKAVAINDQEIMKMYVCLKLVTLWKRRYKKFRIQDGVFGVRRRRICLIFTYFYYTLKNLAYNRAKNCLLWALFTNFQMGQKIREVARHIEFIQSRFLHRNLLQDAKLEILENQWSKLLGILQA